MEMTRAMTAAIEIESAFYCGNRYFHYIRVLKNGFDLVYFSQGGNRRVFCPKRDKLLCYKIRMGWQ